MSVETVKIRPEIDPAALAKVEGQLTKTFSAQGRALSGLKTSFSGFYRDASKASRALQDGRDKTKSQAKALAEASAAARNMKRSLEEAEGTLGKNHKLVREMRAEYTKLALEVGKVKRAEDSRAAAAKRRETLGKMGRAVGMGALAVGGLALGALGGLAAGGEVIRGGMDRAAKSANLAVEEYGRLKHAAELSGTSIEVVEKATAKLGSNLSKGKLDASFEGGLKAIGLTAKDLRGLKPEEQLAKIADGLKGIDDDARRTAISSRLFGEKVGAKLVPMLQGGGKALKDMGDEAQALGLVVTSDAAAAAERLGDAQDKLKKVVTGAATQAFASVVPHLADAAEAAVEWAKANQGPLTEALGGVIEIAGSLWDRLASIDWAGWGSRVQEVAALIGDLASTVIEALGLAGEEGEEFGDSIMEAVGDVALKAFNVITEAVKGLTKIIQGLMPVIQPVAKFLKDVLLGAFEVVGNQIDYVKKQVLAITEAFEDLTSGNFADGFAKLGNMILDSLLQPLRMVAGMLIELADAVPGGSSLVPDALRKFARGAGVGDEGITGPRLGTSEEDVWVEGTGMAAGRAAMQPGVKPKPPKKGKPIEDPIDKGGKGPKKPEEGAGAAQTRKDIEDLAARYGQREYQRAIQEGASLEEARRREIAARDRAKKDLEARAPQLARAGFVGGAGGPSFVGGVGTTAGGAIPVALDLGGRGGPPPVQIIQIMQGAQVDIPISAVASAAEIEGAVRSGIDRVIRESVAEALPLVDSGLRR